MEPQQKILKVHLLIQKRQRRKEKETEIDGTSRGGNDKIMEVNSTSIVIFNVVDEKLQYRVETVKLEKKEKKKKTEKTRPHYMLLPRVSFYIQGHLG